MISGKAKLAGVMGWPVQHSQSPCLHGYWLNQYGIDGAYVPLPVRPEDFDAAFRALPKLGFSGVNITVPHKQKALELVDVIDPVARQIGAVNTVTVSKDGRLTGYNTDGYGFLENLRHGCPDHNPGAGPAVILGAGGAARAIVCSLIDAGVTDLRLVNRTRERADTLARSVQGRVSVYGFSDINQALDGASLLVNTTSLGMEKSPPLEISLEALPAHALVNDIVYAPLRTELLKTAEARGNPVVDGLGMLLYQARAGFEKWFGVLPEVTEDLRVHVLKGMSG